MNNLKKPERVITLINTAALLGASIYFYRKINNLELELNKHSENLTSTIKKVREIIVYKKHFATLGDAIKKLNNSIIFQNRDIEILKEIVKYQSNQIIELQNLIKKLGEDEKIEIKMKENHHLQALNTFYQQNLRQNSQIKTDNMLDSSFNSYNNYSQGTPQLMQQNYQGLPNIHQNQIQQNYPQQNYPGFSPQQNQFQQNNQGNPQQNYQNFPQQNFLPQNFPQQNFPQQNYQQGQGRTNSFQDETDEDDATIDAIRKARSNQNQQQNNDLLDFF